MTDHAEFRVALVGMRPHQPQRTSTPSPRSMASSSSAVCDVVERARARGAGERHGVPWFTSLRRRCSPRCACDVVAICTPSGLHPQHGILAARGREARDLREADGDLAQAGRRARAGVRRRRGSAVRREAESAEPADSAAQARDRQGPVRPDLLANTTVRWTRPQEYYDQAPWRGTWEFDGGAFMNQASHYVDLIQWLGAGGKRHGEDGDARAAHRDGGHRRRRPEVPLRRARRHRGHDADVSAESARDRSRSSVRRER